jgi:hypothetical protein
MEEIVLGIVTAGHAEELEEIIAQYEQKVSNRKEN